MMDWAVCGVMLREEASPSTSVVVFEGGKLEPMLAPSLAATPKMMGTWAVEALWVETMSCEVVTRVPSWTT